MFLSFKDGKIHYTDSGKGDVIVLLHGYLESEEIWRNYAFKLSSNFRVIAIDLPGHGQSDVFSDIHTMEFMALAVKELLVSSGISKVFMVGHSMGGYVSLAFLESFPEYLSGYCLFHSHPLADAPETIEKRINDISIILAGKKDLLISDSISRMYSSSNLDKFDNELQLSNLIASRIPAAGIAAALGGMMSRPSRIDIVEKGKVPFLWILGALDNYINCEMIQQKIKLPPNAQVVILKNSGHMGFIEEEELSLEVIIQFSR
jgi:pimeloyl-ACP methyl ester carboxylesterase